jgi:hypothetical protein
MSGSATAVNQTAARILRPYSGRTVRLQGEAVGVALLVLAAAVAVDRLGAHDLAFYLLLAAVVVTAHAALEAYGRLVELPGSAATVAAARFQATLGLLALALVVVAAAVRAPALGDGSVPALGLSALVGSLALLALQRAVRLLAR